MDLNTSFVDLMRNFEVPFPLPSDNRFESNNEFGFDDPYSECSSESLSHIAEESDDAWHGRRKAIETIYGTWESNFAELPKYITALQTSNPDTVVKWFHNQNSSSQEAKFKYIFWAFGPAIKAFHLCRPVISVDGAHLKGSYKGKLLVAVSKDANK
ncbi:hypothetical protein LXL04_027694 [Taraxacum kok-saghyz]